LDQILPPQSVHPAFIFNAPGRYDSSPAIRIIKAGESVDAVDRPLFYLTEGKAQRQARI